MKKNRIQQSLMPIIATVFFLFSTFFGVTGYAGVPAGNPAVELGVNQTPMVSYTGLPSVDEKPEIETGTVDVHANFFEGDPVLTASTSSAKEKNNEKESQQGLTTLEVLTNQSYEGENPEKNSEALPEALQQQQHRLSNFAHSNEPTQPVIEKELPDHGITISDRVKQVYYFFRAIFPSYSAGYQASAGDLLTVDSNVGASPQEILSMNIAYAMETNSKENAQVAGSVESEKLENANGSLSAEAMSIYGIVPPEVLFRVATNHPFWRLLFNWFLQYQKLVAAAKKGFQVNPSQ